MQFGTALPIVVNLDILTRGSGNICLDYRITITSELLENRDRTRRDIPIEIHAIDRPMET